MLSPHLAVEIREFQALSCRLIQQDNGIGMHLQNGGGPTGGNRTLNQLTHGLGLSRAGCNQQGFSGLHNGSQALGDAVGRNLRNIAIKETSVIAASLFGKNVNVGARGE